MRFRNLVGRDADFESEGSFAEARDTKLQAQQIGDAAGGGERNIQAEGWHAICGALMQCAEGITPILRRTNPRSGRWSSRDSADRRGF